MRPFWEDEPAEVMDYTPIGQDLREALQRIVVCCDNGSEPENKLTFIRRVASDALSRNEAAAQPYPNLRKAQAEGRIDGSRKPDPSERTLRSEASEAEAAS